MEKDAGQAAGDASKSVGKHWKVTWEAAVTWRA